MDERVTNSGPDDADVHLLDYLIILAKHSRMIIYVSAAVTLLTYLVTFISLSKYTATARLLPPQQNLTLSAQLLNNLGGGVTPGTTAGAGGVGGMAAGLLGLKSSSDLYVGMMRGDTVRDHIISRFNLMQLYKTKYLEDARRQLSKNVKIGAGRTDGIIFIEVTSTNPKLTADMANAFMDELDRLLKELAVQEAGGRLAFLEKERVQTGQNLTKAEESLRRFSEQNSVLQIDTQTKGILQYIATLRAEIDAKEVSIQVLRQQATPFNYDMVRLETEIKGLQEKLRSAEVQKDNCLGDVCLPTSKAPSLGLDYLRLYREVKFQESLYQLFNRLVEVARLDLARNVAVIQVLDPGLPPERRANQRLPVAILAGTITFLVMIFVAFWLEYWHKTVRSPHQAARLEKLKNYLQQW